jgi:hypothetical protein
LEEDGKNSEFKKKQKQLMIHELKLLLGEKQEKLQRAESENFVLKEQNRKFVEENKQLLEYVESSGEMINKYENMQRMQ